MTCIFLVLMYKGGPHLVFGDVGISPYRHLSGERDARDSFTFVWAAPRLRRRHDGESLSRTHGVVRAWCVFVAAGRRHRHGGTRYGRLVGVAPRR